MSDVPELPAEMVKEIVEKADFRTMMTIRRASSGLQAFIDKTKPDGKFTMIGIHLRVDSIYLHYVNQDDDEDAIIYWKRENGYMLEHNNKETIFENGNYFDAFYTDIGTILEFQRGVLSSFLVCAKEMTYEATYTELTTQLANTMQTSRIVRNQFKPLKVDCFHIESVNEGQVLGILQNLDPQFLKTILIIDPTKPSGKYVIEIDRIRATPQWGTLQEVFIEDVCIPNETETNVFIGFSKVDIMFNTINVERLVDIKQAFFNTPRLLNFKIGYFGFEEMEDDENLDDEENVDDEENFDNEEDRRLYEALGIPFIRTGEEREDAEEREWFFRIPNSDQVLLIFNKNTAYYYFQYSRINTGDVPEGATIQD